MFFDRFAINEGVHFGLAENLIFFFQTISPSAIKKKLIALLTEERGNFCPDYISSLGRFFKLVERVNEVKKDCKFVLNAGELKIFETIQSRDMKMIEIFVAENESRKNFMKCYQSIYDDLIAEVKKLPWGAIETIEIDE